MDLSDIRDVLVLFDGDLAAVSLASAVRSIGYAVHHATFKRPLQRRTPPRVVLLVVDHVSSRQLEKTIEDLRAVWDVPILITEITAGALATVPPPNGTFSVPSSLPAEALGLLLDCLCERHAQRAQLDHYQALLQSAPVGVFEVSGGSVSFANEYLLERTQYTLDELRNIPLESLVISEDRSRLQEAISTLPERPENAPPNIYRFLTAQGEVFVGEVRSRVIHESAGSIIEGTIRDITQETRIMQLHRVVLELTEVILAEQDIDRILQLVLDTLVEHSGFRRALLTLYDLSIPVPFEGPVHKMLTSGLTEAERSAIHSQDPIPLEWRKDIYSDRFQLGPAYYIPHDETPWSESHGLSGNVSVEGWHPDDYLFIPLRGMGGIIGSISIDDPVDQSAPTIASMEPVAFLANFAAFAVERVFKLQQMRKQADQLHELASLGAELARGSSERTLCETAAERVRSGMGYDACGIYLIDGLRLNHEAMSARGEFPQTELPDKGSWVLLDGPGITRWVLSHGEPAIIPDVTKDARFDGTRETIRSYIALPIEGRKGPIGVIYAACTRLAAFGEQDLQMLSAVASHLATALSALRRRSALNRIFAFGQHLAVASTVPQATTSTLDFLTEQFDFQLSAILMIRDGEALEVAGVGGAYGGTTMEPGRVTSAESGITGWVAQNRMSAVVPDVSKDDRYYPTFAGTRSELAVPILFSDRILGVINIESSQLHAFDDEDRRLIEVVANHLATALTNIEAQAELREQAVRDPLTGLFNRHYFNSIIASELSRSDRYGHPLSLMMIDVDGFRAVNNRLGHLTGDVVLQNVARLLERNVRDSDRVIRYGGDEFLILMPETNGQGHSGIVADRLRHEIAHVLEGTGAENSNLSLGLSIGIYTRLPDEKHPLEAILEEVDRRMYADKRQRNEDHADDYRY